MEGIIICGAILAAIMFMRSQAQETQQGAFATVRDVSDDNGASDVAASNSLSLFEHSSRSSDDDWSASSMLDDSFLAGSCGFDTGLNTDRRTDPAYAYELDNIWHGTLIDPTYHDDSSSSFDDNSPSLFDDSFSSSSSCDDSSSSSFDDSWSSTSFDDSFSSGSSFND